MSVRELGSFSTNRTDERALFLEGEARTARLRAGLHEDQARAAHARANLLDEEARMLREAPSEPDDGEAVVFRRFPLSVINATLAREFDGLALVDRLGGLTEREIVDVLERYAATLIEHRNAIGDEPGLLDRLGALCDVRLLLFDVDQDLKSAELEEGTRAAALRDLVRVAAGCFADALDDELTLTFNALEN